MRWSKIKNIIILLLVVVNGFLLGQVGLRKWHSRRGELETRERMVDILARNDVSYLPQEVPGTLDLSSRRVTLSPFGETEAALLVGEITDVQTAGTRTLYTGAEGVVSVSAAGELTVEFVSGSLLSEGTVLDRLSRLGVHLEQTGTYDGAGETGVSYTQLWDGIPVSGMSASLAFSAQTPHTLSLSPQVLRGSEEILPTEETITAATALARLLNELSRGEGYVCSQITDMYAGYVPGGGDPVTLTPAWFIETDTWRFVVDAVTGTVTAAE